MASAAWKAMAGLMVAAVVDTAASAAAQVPAGAPAAEPVITRVRARDDHLARLILDAAKRSSTFRNLVETIEVSHGIVYVERGRCRHGARACLEFLGYAPPYRLLRIVLDDRKTDAELIGSLGHELQHVREVLDDPTVTSAAALVLFYSWHAKRMNDVFETAEAINVGDAVRRELRKANRSQRHKTDR
jgi:hypothetical protein